MVAEGLKNTRDGGAMGYLKIPPSCQKALHIARKFSLVSINILFEIKSLTEVNMNFLFVV